MQSFSWNNPWFSDPVIQKMSDAAQEFRFFLNAIAFSIILFVIFLRRSMKERERQRELASKWKSLNDKIKAARSILIMRQLAKKKRYQKEIRSKWPKWSNVSLFISNTSSNGSDESIVNMVTLDIKTCLPNMIFVGTQSQGNSDYLVGPRADSLIKSSEFNCISELYPKGWYPAGQSTADMVIFGDIHSVHGHCMTIADHCINIILDEVIGRNRMILWRQNN